MYLAEFERHVNTGTRLQKILLHVLYGAVFLLTASLLFHFLGGITFYALRYWEIPTTPAIEYSQIVHSWIDWIFMGIFSIFAWILWVVWKVVFYGFWGLAFVFSLLFKVLSFVVPYFVTAFKSGILITYSMVSRV